MTIATAVSAPDNKRASLTDKHRGELRASGLTDATIEAAGIYSVATDQEIAAIIKWTSRLFTWNGGYVIPYLHTDGYCRFKPDWPRPDSKTGKPVKYESPKSSGNHAYFPPGFQELDATSKARIITEGEKKALSIQQFTGKPCIGLSGVWNWQQRRPKDDNGKAYGKRKLIADLEGVDWRGKIVTIVFDSDAATNDLVRHGECALALELIDRGAKVLVARIPPDGSAKVGADDFLVKRGASAFQEVLAVAEEAERPEPPSLMDMARMYLSELHDHAAGPTLRWYRDEFHKWHGTHYRAVPDSAIDASILQWLDSRNFHATPKRAVDVRKCLASEVYLDFAREHPFFISAPAKPPVEPITTASGIIDLTEVARGESITVRPHTPVWFSPTALPYAFAPNAKCPTWFETLDSIFDGDIERVNLLGEWFGYCLSTDTRLHKMMLLQGPPRSGKGTIMRCLTAVVGEENCVALTLSELGERFALSDCVGKRVAICPDAHLGRGDKAISVLEKLKSISGEDAIPVERKFKPTQTMRLRIRITLGVNELPKLSDHAGAMGPRLCILTCRNSFVGREDRTLEEKIRGELDGVFCWAAEGLYRLRQQGEFTRPAASRQIEDDFANLTSPIRSFVEECCTRGSGQEVDRDEFFEIWKLWCDKNGHAAGSIELVGTRLHTLLPSLDSVNRRVGNGKRRRFYVGIGIDKSVAMELGSR